MLLYFKRFEPPPEMKRWRNANLLKVTSDLYVKIRVLSLTQTSSCKIEIDISKMNVFILHLVNEWFIQSIEFRIWKCISSTNYCNIIRPNAVPPPGVFCCLFLLSTFKERINMSGTVLLLVTSSSLLQLVTYFGLTFIHY